MASGAVDHYYTGGKYSKTLNDIDRLLHIIEYFEIELRDLSIEHKSNQRRYENCQ